jgi:hypothetical protein
MGNRPPCARLVVARRSEDVRAVREACQKGPRPPALEGFPGGYAFRNGRAGHRRVSKSRGGGSSSAFPARHLAREGGASGGQAAHLSALTVLSRRKPCERRGGRVPLIRPNGRPDVQAGGVCWPCLPNPAVPPFLSCDGG